MSAEAARHIETRISSAGFAVLGWFKPEPHDRLGDLGSGRPVRSAVIVGNAGPGMWRRFMRERTGGRDTLDRWTADVLGELARAAGGRAYFPFDKPPLPFQQWAKRSGRVFSSPLGMTIHPEFGLWHAFRAVLVFPEEIGSIAQNATASPCESCAGKPCLATCPVDAFTPGAYDVHACATHMRTEAGLDCLTRACRARRACPVGRDYIYEAPQAEFHMRAFVAAIPEKRQ